MGLSTGNSLWRRSERVSPQAISSAAQELVDRYGGFAVESLSLRSAALASEGRWLEHDLALLVLGEVERRLASPAPGLRR